jgi:TetR/AcrR family tetracycline transcriptional repressor
MAPARAKAGATAAPKLTREQIVATARALLAEVGIDGLTMRRLGEACGVRGPALYWHFKDKDELVGLIVDSVIGDLYAGADDQPWDTWVLELGRNCRQLLLAHPGLATAVAAGYSLPERVVEGLDSVAGVLADAGFTPGEALSIHYSVLTFTIGFVIYEAASPTFAVLKTPVGHDERSDTRRKYEDLAGDRFPNLGELATSLEVLTVDDMFDQGLVALVQGWADRLEHRG